jgi:glycosyltransferase involved in cell wall biosynthesis
MPLFTIVTATKDRPEELSVALRSVLEQDCGDFELLVVDDASEGDGTRDAAADCADARIRVIRREESGGPAVARNAAVQQAGGRYIAILDDDDAMLPGRLARTAARFEADPGLALLGGGFRVMDGEGNELATVALPTDEARIRANLLRHNPFCHSTCSVRTDILRDVGAYREAMRYSEDYDMILRVAERGGIAMLAEPLSLYRFHVKNISTTRAFVQGAYADVARECARRRGRGQPEELGALAAAIRVPEAVSESRARARAHYQLGEWLFRDGRVREARPHLHIALKSEPLRPLCVGLTLAAWMPGWLRRILAPLVRPLAAARYPSWR